MAACIVGCQYIPSIEYFAHWIHHEHIMIEAHEHFQKRSWRNKTAILGPVKPLILSVPLKKGKHNQMPVQDVAISYDEPWHRVHFNSINSTYGKTAYFMEMEEDLRNLLFSQPARLWDLNIRFLEFILSFLPAQMTFELTTDYNESAPFHLPDLRKGIPAGISTIPDELVPSYEQVQRLNNSHQPNLSILDALCHLGPHTGDYLKRYAAQLYPQQC